MLPLIRQRTGISLLLLSCLMATACGDNQEQTASSGSGDSATGPTAATDSYDYEGLRLKISSGKADLAEVRQALTDRQPGSLTNTLHALYSMRWHRGVYNLLYDMWADKRDKYPELAWDLIAKAPTRIALASTINRLQITDTGEFDDYIRSHGHDEHEFHRAQVVVALGFNGDPADVDYIESMADGDNHYVAQSAITALALMNHTKAADTLISLWHKHRGTPRGGLIEELLQQTYKITPEKMMAGPEDQVPSAE